MTQEIIINIDNRDNKRLLYVFIVVYVYCIFTNQNK